MKSYKEYLIEKISDIVYHKTSIQSAANILKSNKFKLSSAIGTPSELQLNKGKAFYFSTARTPNSAYINDPTSGDLYFVLDGDKLNQNYKGKAVDYWGPTFRSLNKDEMEDRIFTNKQFISPAINYIKEIHFLLSYEYITRSILFGDELEIRNINENQLLALKVVYSICKKNNIPLYAYNNINHYLTKNKNKAVNVLEVLKDKNAFKLKGSTYQSIKRKPYYSEIAELLSKPIKQKKEFKDNYEWNDYLKSVFSDKAYKVIYKLTYYVGDAIKSLEVDLHNMKSDEKISDFIKIMNKYKLKTAEDVIKYLQNKFKWEEQ